MLFPYVWESEKMAFSLPAATLDIVEIVIEGVTGDVVIFGSRSRGVFYPEGPPTVEIIDPFHLLVAGHMGHRYTDIFNGLVDHPNQKVVYIVAEGGLHLLAMRIVQVQVDKLLDKVSGTNQLGDIEVDAEETEKLILLSPQVNRAGANRPSGVWEMVLKFPVSSSVPRITGKPIFSLPWPIERPVTSPLAIATMVEVSLE